MEDRVAIDPEALLAEMGWVRALAGRLVRDTCEAEDLAQDALVAALSGARQEPRLLRKWLGAVVRNLRRNAVRRESARARTEGPLKEDPALPSTLELLERAATQRALVGALLELKEPDRSVLLLRYFQELTNEEIARKWGLPASTIASRVARAHARLREKWLAQNGGDRRTALSALAALARLAPQAPSIPTEVLAPGHVESSGLIVALQAAGIASAAVGAAWWWLPAAAQERRAHPVLTAQVAAHVLVQDASLEVEGAAAFQRSAVPMVPRPSRPVCPASAAQRHPIRGRVLDREGRPVAGLEMCRIAPFATLPEQPLVRRGARTEDCAISDDDGRFTVQAPLLGWFEPTSPGWAAVISGELGLNESGEALIVVARSQPLSGRIVDEQGRALESVEVALAIAPEELLALSQELKAALPLPPAPSMLVTNKEGAFSFPDAPQGNLVLEASKEGFDSKIVELADSTTSDSELEALHLVLQRSSLPAVTGTVVDGSGRPVEGASVSAGQGIAITDAAGSFLVTFDPGHRCNKPSAEPLSPQSICVRAVRMNLGCAEREIAFPRADAPASLELVLAGGERTIEGRVTDLGGAPVASAEVFVLEDTPFGWVESSGWIHRRSLESMLGAHPAFTSADGSFRISGLADRSYRLQVLQGTSLLTAVSEPIPSGSRGVRLTLDLDARGMIAGRVIDRHARPVEGVRVSLSCRQWWEGPSDTDFALAIGASAKSDSEGRFALESVARQGVFLRLEGESIVHELFRYIDPSADPAMLELVVGRRSFLQLDWGDWREHADRLHLEDEKGSSLGFMNLGGFSDTPQDRMSVGIGLSPTVAIPDLARHAVLTSNGKEVLRVPLHPLPGELAVVQL